MSNLKGRVNPFMLLCVFLLFVFSQLIADDRASGYAVYGPVPVNTTQPSYQSYTTYGPLWVNTIQRPLFSLPAGNYTGTQTISLSSTAGSNAKIRYTLNNSDPSMQSGLLYSTPITISSTTTIKAVTYLEGVSGSLSPVASSTYTIGTPAETYLDYQIQFAPPISASVSKVRLYARTMAIVPYAPYLTYKYRYVEKLNVSNAVAFSSQELGSILGNNYSIYQINLYDYSDDLIGHMAFNYNLADLQAPKKVSAQLIVHGEHQSYSGSLLSPWNYYDSGEHMVSMLIRPSTIHTGKQPLLLVHGINGEYPYFPTAWKGQLNGGVSNPDNGLYYDIWEFYYPYDQQIEQSAPLLGDAISRVKTIGYQGRINLLAHSMGGLVTRQLIQSSAYQQNTNSGYYQSIGKFLMLGTPNHGSHSSLMAYEGIVESVAYITAIGGDRGAPALKELFPGSDFLINLNSQAPLPLYQGANLQNTCLVIAGKRNPINAPLNAFVGEVHGPANNDDMVVSIPSASLLDANIPLGIVNFDHQALVGDNSKTPGENPLNPQFLHLFFDNCYNAGNTILDSYVSEFYTTQPGNEALASLLQVRFNKNIHSDTVHSDLLETQQGYMLQLRFGLTDVPSFDPWAFIFNNWLEKSGSAADHSSTDYFMQQRLGGFLRQNGTLPTGNYQIQLRNNLFQPFMTIPGAFSIHPGITTMAEISLTDGEYALAMLNNTNSCLQRGRYRDEQNRNYIEEQYYVDSSCNKMVFYVGGDEDIADFSQHNAYLLDPEGNTIDPAYAQNDPEMEYHEDLSAKYAYYYVNAPQTGLWRLRYNDSIPSGLSSNLIDSPYAINMLIDQQDYMCGDVVSVQLPLPEGDAYSEANFSLSLSYVNADSVTVNEGALTCILNSDDNCYDSSFVPAEPGLYTLSASFQCIADSTIVRRYSERSLEVLSIRAPEIISPASGTGNLDIPLTLSWEALPSADSYHVDLYASGESEPLMSQDTGASQWDVAGLSHGQEYLWNVSASNEYGISPVSATATFGTQPVVTDLIYPADAAIDLPQTVQLQWQTIDGAQAYHLQVAQDSLFAACWVDDASLSTGSYELTSLGVLQTYYWRVAVADQYGQGDWTDTSSFCTRAAQIEFPALVTLEENTSHSLYLQDYIDNFDPDAYQVEISGNSFLITEVFPDRIEISPPPQWFGMEALQITVSDVSALRRSGIFEASSLKAMREVIYQSILQVSVSEVNDPPVLSLQDNLLYWRGEAVSLNLTDYISDPDTPLNEIQIEVAGGTHLGWTLNGTILEINPDPGWDGYEILAITLSDSGRLGRRFARETRSEQSYEILFQIVNAQPSISEFSLENGEVQLSWQAIAGAYSYLVFSSENSQSGWLDVTGLGTLSTLGSLISWRQLSPAERAFYYIKASKGTRLKQTTKHKSTSR